MHVARRVSMQSKRGSAFRNRSGQSSPGDAGAALQSMRLLRCGSLSRLPCSAFVRARSHPVRPLGSLPAGKVCSFDVCFLAKLAKTREQAGDVTPSDGIAGHLLATWRQRRHQPRSFAQFQRDENCAKIDESSGLLLRLICCHRHGWPPERFLATSLCHGAGRYSPLMGTQELNRRSKIWLRS